MMMRDQVVERLVRLTDSLLLADRTVRMELERSLAAFLALPVLECIDFVSDVGGVDEAPQYVVVEVAESQGDAA